jgi:flavin-binding protein dodecin
MDELVKLNLDRAIDAVNAVPWHEVHPIRDKDPLNSVRQAYVKNAIKRAVESVDALKSALKAL